MIKYEDRCCDCAVPAYPCRGASCPLRNVEVHYCDKCGDEIGSDEIYKVNGAELCAYCYEEADNG